MSKKCTIKDIKISQFDGIELANGRLTLKLIPEIGGKVTSIFHGPSQREWLAQNPHLPLRIPEYDGTFVEQYDSGGLDECFPSITAIDFPASPWENSRIPDHGELWCLPWDVTKVEVSDEKVRLAMVCYGVRLPYRLERVLTMLADGDTITFDYTLTNLSPFTLPFVWSIHPILNIEPGMILSLPTSVNELRIDSTVHDDYVGFAGEMCTWDSNLMRIPEPGVGQAVKLYTSQLAENEMVETAVSIPQTQHRIGFRFNPQEVTHVGLWLNYGGWSGCGSAPYFNLGLEPCIGGADSLLTAMQLDDYAILPGKESRKWSLEMFVN